MWFFRKDSNVMLKKHFEETKIVNHIIWFKFGTKSKFFKENPKILETCLYCEKENQRSLLGDLYFGDFTYDEFVKKIETLNDVLGNNTHEYSFSIKWNIDFSDSVFNRKSELHHRNPINIKRYYSLNYSIKPIQGFYKEILDSIKQNLSPSI